MGNRFRQQGSGFRGSRVPMSASVTTFTAVCISSTTRLRDGDVSRRRMPLIQTDDKLPSAVLRAGSSSRYVVQAQPCDAAQAIISILERQGAAMRFGDLAAKCQPYPATLRLSGEEWDK